MLVHGLLRTKNEDAQVNRQKMLTAAVMCDFLDVRILTEVLNRLLVLRRLHIDGHGPLRSQRKCKKGV